MSTIPTIAQVAEVMAAPVMVDWFFDSVDGGRTPEELCEEMNVPLGHLLAWVRLDPARVARLATASAGREEFLRQRLQREWADVAFSDVRDLFGPTGRLKPIEDWPRGISKSLSSYQVEEIQDAADKDGTEGAMRVVRKYKLWDKLRASELLAKNLGMLSDRVTVSGTVTLEHALADSWPGQRVTKPADTTLDEAPTAKPMPRQISTPPIAAKETDPGFLNRPAPPKNQVGSEQNEL